MPAEAIEATRERHPELAERDRRERDFLRRVGGVAGEARHPHHARVERVVRFEAGVVERPVVGDAVERADLEVRWSKPGEVRRVEDGAAADRIEHRHRDRRLRIVDGVVLAAPARVRAEVEVGGLAHLPVGRDAGEVGGLHPIALLETDDVHARLCEAPRQRRPRRAGADDEHVRRHLRHGVEP